LSRWVPPEKESKQKVGQSAKKKKKLQPGNEKGANSSS
jgi:hypothetical protein